MTDAELIRASQAGSKAAMGALYRRYLPSVWRYVYARLAGNIPVVEDVVSETFLAAVRAVREFDPKRGSVGAWIMGIARHKLVDHQRRTTQQTSSTVAALCARPSPHEADPAASLETVETKEVIAAVVDALADEERLVLEWKYLDGLSTREIGGRLGRTEKAAEALLYRARRSFRSAFNRRNRAEKQTEGEVDNGS